MLSAINYAKICNSIYDGVHGTGLTSTSGSPAEPPPRAATTTRRAAARRSLRSRSSMP